MAKAKKKDAKDSKKKDKSRDSAKGSWSRDVKAPAKAAPKATRKKEVPEEEGVRGIVRLAGKDVRGHIPLKRALLAVKGIGHTTSKSVAKIIAMELKVKPDVKVGTFTDAQIEQIDGILARIQDHGLPSYLLNRRKDAGSGKDVHNTMNDLVFSHRQDIENEKKVYTWKGYRHAYGQKVRGQRTKNTGRHGMSLGVVRKAQQPASAGGKPAEKGKK